MAKDENDGGEVVRSTIGEFCKQNETYRAELARRLGVVKQQLSNWQRSGCLVEHDIKTGDVKIIRAEKVIGNCKLSDLSRRE